MQVQSLDPQFGSLEERTDLMLLKLITTLSISVLILSPYLIFLFSFSLSCSHSLETETKTWEVFDNLPVGVYSQSCIALPITTVKSMEYALTGLNCLRVHTRAKEEIRVVMFGGFDGVSNRNDVYLFDSEHKTWKKSAIRGRNIPAPRSDHTASLVGTYTHFHK